jgi:hypothetical protein
MAQDGQSARVEDSSVGGGGIATTGMQFGSRHEFDDAPGLGLAYDSNALATTSAGSTPIEDDWMRWSAAALRGWRIRASAAAASRRRECSSDRDMSSEVVVGHGRPGRFTAHRSGRVAERSRRGDHPRYRAPSSPFSGVDVGCARPGQTSQVGRAAPYRSSNS